MITLHDSDVLIINNYFNANNNSKNTNLFIFSYSFEIERLVILGTCVGLIIFEELYVIVCIV